MRNSPWARTVRSVATVIKMRSDEPAATIAANCLPDETRECVIRPSQCMGMKTE